MITIEASELDSKALPGLDLQLQALGHETAVVPHLAAGDYLWVVPREDSATVCLTERKKPNDLIASFDDGRLTRFVEEAPPGSWRCVLVHLPDNLRRLQGGLGYAGWSWPRFDDVLLSLQAEGISIAWAIDGICGVAERLNALYHWTQKAEHTSLHRPVVPAPAGLYLDPTYRKQVAALMCSPGIGEVLARTALEIAGGRLLRAVGLLAAGRVDGVGPTRAEDAKRFWRGR